MTNIMGRTMRHGKESQNKKHKNYEEKQNADGTHKGSSATAVLTTLNDKSKALLAKLTFSGGVVISYEDAEGLLVNVGVVAALMLSLSVATTYMHWPGDTDKAVLFSNMRADFYFRNDFIKRWISDNGIDFQDRNYVKFKPEYPGGPREEAFAIGDLLNNEPSAEEVETSEFSRNVEVLFFMILGECDDDDMRSKLFNEGLGWIRLNNPEDRPDGQTPKFDYFKYGNMATVIFFASLMMSLLFYTTLAVSSAGETDVGLQHWMRFGGLAIFICYILMITGMTYFFLSLSALSRVQYAWKVYGDWMDQVAIGEVLMPLMLVSVILSGVLFWGAAVESMSNAGWFSCCDGWCGEDAVAIAAEAEEEDADKIHDIAEGDDDKKTRDGVKVKPGFAPSAPPQDVVNVDEDL